MNAPNRLEAIRIAQQRISELEEEICVLKSGEGSQLKPEFTEKLAKLMKRYKLNAEEVIALLLIRGDIDKRAFSLATVWQLRHILGLKDVEASHSSEKRFRVRGWVNVDVR